MACEVEFTDEFQEWWDGLTEAEQISIAASVGLLETAGVNLKHPHSSGINGSRHGHKTGDDRWYDTKVPLADRLYDVHLEELKKEGEKNG